MRYVYLLQSTVSPSQRYVGVTSDLKRRLNDHNSGKLPYTAQYRPWTLATYAAFSSPLQAGQFERYLKSGSGHAFAKKHLWPCDAPSKPAPAPTISPA